jgi:uncharacterized protein DUF4350
MLSAVAALRPDGLHNAEGGVMNRLGKGVVALAMLLVAGIVPVHATQTVVFDEGHGERFVVGKKGDLDLSSLGELFRKQEVEVKTVAVPLTDEQLAGADALVISGPFAPLSAAEVESIDRFLERGGRLVVMLHIGAPLADLLHGLGVDFSNSVIRERHNVIADDPLNFRVTGLEQHPLLAGLTQFSLYGGWALMGFAENVRALASTSVDAWVDLNGDRKLSPDDAVQSFGVVVAGTRGRGEFVVFGDDAIFQNKFLDADNAHLAKNLAAWLCGGKR